MKGLVLCLAVYLLGMGCTHSDTTVLESGDMAADEPEPAVAAGEPSAVEDEPALPRAEAGPPPADMPEWVAEQLGTKREPGQRPWTWPVPGEFGRFWRARDAGVRPLGLVHAKARGQEAVIAVARGEKTQVALEAFVVTGDHYGLRSIEGGWDIDSGSCDQVGLVKLAGRDAETLEVLEVYEVPTISSEHWALWTYATTLVNSSAPVRRPNTMGYERTAAEGQAVWARFTAAAEGNDVRAAKEILEELLARTDVSPFDEAWSDALRFVLEHNEELLAIRIYSRWIPMGRCSMDTRPQRVAADFAALCQRRGDLGCFLQLRVQIMGDQFARVAYSSYGEEAHGTESAVLADSGVHASRFLLGMMLEYSHGPRRHARLWPWRLGRAMAEGGDPAASVSTLEALVRDETLDPYNRLRATATLLSVLRNQPVAGIGPDTRPTRAQVAQSAAAACRHVAALGLHPASRACARNHVVFVSCTVDAGFHPHMMIMRELRKSWRELCVERVP